MLKRFHILIFITIALCALSFPGIAATLGPASSYQELLDLSASAGSGDTLLVSGEFDASGPALTPFSNIRIQSDKNNPATIRSLRLEDASVLFTDIRLHDLSIQGASSIQLGRSVHITGSDHRSALTFTGSGTLILDRGCSVTAGRSGTGATLSHTGGDFYASIEGNITGGSGRTGGPGLVVSPLTHAAAMMISGSIEGGDGDSLGGHALNLYDLSGNAYITIDGILHGGSGSIGGDGLQIVSSCDNVNVGVSGRIHGGAGESHGGSAVILMNATESSSFHFSGVFTGGDALSSSAEPGTSLQLVGESAVMRTHINNCILEDGRRLYSQPVIMQPSITPLPVIPDLPASSPAPETPSDVQPTETSMPAPEAVEDPTPSHEPSAEPSPTPEILSDSSDDSAPLNDTGSAVSDIPEASAHSSDAL